MRKSKNSPTIPDPAAHPDVGAALERYNDVTLRLSEARDELARLRARAEAERLAGRPWASEAAEQLLAGEEGGTAVATDIRVEIREQARKVHALEEAVELGRERHRKARVAAGEQMAHEVEDDHCALVEEFARRLAALGEAAARLGQFQGTCRERGIPMRRGGVMVDTFRSDFGHSRTSVRLKDIRSRFGFDV